MKKLSPEALQVIARGRADDPTPSDRERVKRRLSAALATGAALTAVAAGGRALAAAWAPKVLAVVALAASGLVLFEALHQAPPPGPPPAPAAAPAPPPTAVAEPAPPPAVQVPPAPPPARRAPTVGPQPPAQEEGPTQAPVPSAISPPPEDQLVAETNALRAAHAELRAGHAERALLLLDEQLVHFRGGTLEQERVAARVLALCQLGQRVVAQEELAAFELAFPGSPLLSRVRAACAAP